MDYEFPASPPDEAWGNFGKQRLWNGELPTLYWLLGWNVANVFHDVEYADIPIEELSEGSLALVSTLDRLRFLDISGQVPGSADNCAVNDRLLARLESLDNLEYLYLRNTAVTDAGLSHLMNLRSLRRLDVAGTRVSSEGIASIRQALPNCVVIDH